ncbi:MAG: hypothetical protein NVS9B5_24970 [Terriglobales bacterium]
MAALVAAPREAAEPESFRIDPAGHNATRQGKTADAGPAEIALNHAVKRNIRALDTPTRNTLAESSAVIAVALNVAAVPEELTTCLADFRDAPAAGDLDDIPIRDFLAADTAADDFPAAYIVADDLPTGDWGLVDKALARKPVGADLVGDFVRKRLKRSRLSAMPGKAPWRRCSSAHWPLWSEIATFYSSIPA